MNDFDGKYNILTFVGKIRPFMIIFCLMLGRIEGKRRRGRQRMMRWLDGITDSTDMILGKLRVGDRQGGLACYSPWGCKESDRT